MSTPEIHIRASKHRKSKREASFGSKQDAVVNLDKKLSKRRRVNAQCDLQIPSTAKEEDMPQLKSDLLSNNTQSFRHLFSFGSANMHAENATNANATNANITTSEVTAAIDDNGARVSLTSEAVVRFTVFDEEEDILNVRADPSAAVPVDVASDTACDASVVCSPTPETRSDYVIHDGLALDSPAVVRALALDYCGHGRTVAELQAEWMDGGKKNGIREDLRLKRYKRLRGRVLGKSGSRDGIR